MQIALGNASPHSLRTWLSMAGVLLLLLGIISVISIMFQDHPQAEMASATNAAPRPQFVLEEIGVYKDQNNQPYQIKKYEKQLKRLNTNPILEGDPSKELRVQKRVFIDLKNQALRMNNSSSTISINESKVDQVYAFDQREQPEHTIKDLAIEEDEILNGTGLVNDLDASAEIGLEQFQWLLGKWEAQGTSTPSRSFSHQDDNTTADRRINAAREIPSSQRSTEEWHQVDPFTIEGNGYVLIDGVAQFKESMQIKKIGSDLYYSLEIDQTGQTQQYLLKSFNKGEIIFENKALTFPKQVILRPDASNRHFTTLLQNSSPSQLNSEQQQYFQQRNQISTEQIRRELSRVER